MAEPQQHTLAIARHDGGTVLATPRDDGTWDQMDAGPGWWPTWRPGSRQFAVSHVTRPGSPGGRAVLQLVDLASGGRLDVPGSSNVPARLIADRLAHYPLWSPDGRLLSYVTPAGRALASRIWETGESGERTLMGGAPLFTSWSADSQAIAVHHGGSLTVIDARTWREHRISDNAAGFRTACFPTTGEVAFGEPASTGVRLTVADITTGTRREGPVLSGGLAFAPVPGRNAALAGITPGDEAGVFNDVLLVEWDDPRAAPQRFLKGPLMAFWWSPDGSRLAVLVPSYSGDGRFQVRFHRSNGVFECAMEPTTLSQDMRTLVSFFDQYALSHSLWSADGRYFAVSGRIASEGPHASFADGNLDSVLVADLETGGPWVRVGHGLCGFFPR